MASNWEEDPILIERIVFDSDTIDTDGLPSEDNWDRKEVKLFAYFDDDIGLGHEEAGYALYVHDKSENWLNLCLGLSLAFTITLTLSVLVICLFLMYDCRLLAINVQKFMRWVEKLTKTFAGVDNRRVAKRKTLTAKDWYKMEQMI